MVTFAAPAFLRVPDLVNVAGVELAGQTLTVPGSIHRTGMWYERARADGGVMILIAEATGPDALTSEVVIEVLDSALAGGGPGLSDTATPGDLLDELRQYLGSIFADRGMGCVAQAVLVQPGQGRFQAAYGGGIVPQHASGTWDEIDLPVVGFPLIGVPILDSGTGYPGAASALGAWHRYFTSTGGLFPDAPLPGLGPIALRAFLNSQPAATPSDQLISAVLAEAAQSNGADWPAVETAALAWRLVGG